MQNRNIFLTLALIFAFALFYYFLFSPPKDFVAPVVVRIEAGDSLREASLRLREANIIRSRFVFEALVRVFGRGEAIKADYYFDTKLPVTKVARRISKGDHDMPPVVVTIPEGFDNVEVGDVFATKLPNFDKTEFLAKTKDLQGYLFPDTYFFLTTDGVSAAILSLTENFNKKIKSLQTDIQKSGKSEKDIITMASIIEGEANGAEDRALISGILWKRLKIGMPLQADAAPVTYQAKGLPKSPIGNPGLAAIKVAIYPENSEYLYYLHDKQGGIHYARTYRDHLRNISKYLK